MKTVIVFALFANVALSSYVLDHPFLQTVNAERESNVNVDPGDALILTPLIEAGKIEEAKQQSLVNHTDFGNVSSYSGFYTVNKAFNSNLFFWFFPAENGYETAPVILWLQGGPGSSSLFGLFTGNGPFAITDEDQVTLRSHSWHKNYSLLFVDNPSGTGFSFTSRNGFCRNQTQVGKELYQGVYQFFQLFPELQKNDFFITGESYAGKYIPALAYTIHSENPNANVKINLQGLAIGNGFIDPRSQSNYADFLYQIGLIGSSQRNFLRICETSLKTNIDAGQYKGATKIFATIVALISKYSGCDNPYNFLIRNNPANKYFKYISKYVVRNDVRKALHVGNLTYHSSIEVSLALYEDFAKSVAPWLSELLNHYRVLLYSGQLDIIVAYPLTQNFLRNFTFSASHEYKVARRHGWYVGDKLAGYVKTAGNLTDLMVRNAGHLVIAEQPVWSLDMIDKFTKGLPL